MNPRVVCISRALAAGGEYIARAVLQELGFRHIDDEVIHRSAGKEGVEIVFAAARG